MLVFENEQQWQISLRELTSKKKAYNAFYETVYGSGWILRIMGSISISLKPGLDGLYKK